MGHSGDHFLIHGHLLFNGPLHANQTDTELVFEQLADSANTPVSEMIDIVDLPDILPKLQQVGNHRIKICRLQNPFLERGCEVQLNVEFQTSDFREIVLTCVEEHTFEERSRRFQCWRIAWTELPIDLDQSFLICLDRVLAKRLAQDNADVVTLRKEDGQFRNTRVDNRPDDVLRQFVIGFNDNFARVCVDDITDGKRSFEIFRINLEALDLRLFDVIVDGASDLLSGVDQYFLGFGMRYVLRDLQTNDVVGNIPKDLFAFDC